MQWVSTRGDSPAVTLREAILESLPSDGGLYMPAGMPELSDDLVADLQDRSFPEIATEICYPFLNPDLSWTEIEGLVGQSLSFEIPLIVVQEGISVLELFHGPTAAFKDVGAQFMARLVGHLVRGEDTATTILTATSGDTGGAVAAGFHGVQGIQVVILFPSGRVSELQRRQIAGWGGNITALEVDGSFDDCQQMVKRAFLDNDIQEKQRLCSANSINIARLIPQSFYYFWGYSQWLRAGGNRDIPPVFSVPSGNFGNLTAGIMAMKIGLPVNQFIAATNLNKVVPEYLRTGLYQPRPSIETMSSAMDVGDPSNFERLTYLFRQDKNAMAEYICGIWIDEEQTAFTMRDVFEKNDYLLDPHGAVGYAALVEYRKKNDGAAGIVLETAHPGKFASEVAGVLGREIEIPAALRKYEKLKVETVPMDAGFTQFKQYLLDSNW